MRLNLSVQYACARDACPPRDDVKRWVRAALDPDVVVRADITVRFVDAEEGRALNLEYRGRDYATNVLSFPAAQNPEGFLGDLALAFGVCAREADQQNKSLADHLQHLVAHGVLHLVGYDHMNEDEAADMEGLERRILAGLGVADPYAAEQGDHD